MLGFTDNQPVSATSANDIPIIILVSATSTNDIPIIGGKELWIAHDLMHP